MSDNPLDMQEQVALMLVRHGRGRNPPITVAEAWGDIESFKGVTDHLLREREYWNSWKGRINMIGITVRNFWDGFQRGQKRERALSRYRRLMKDPHRFTFRERGQIYRELAETTHNDELRDTYIEYAAQSERMADKYDPDDGENS